ncbi:hypothetical protein QBC43DRAFT_335328 [Cladorrhinum sp. PSN259]|nr:hypothetical protein QBC43DRAFT_335328 [Cladorrhinum sp. PSN259]
MALWWCRASTGQEMGSWELSPMLFFRGLASGEKDKLRYGHQLRSTSHQDPWPNQGGGELLLVGGRWDNQKVCKQVGLAQSGGRVCLDEEKQVSTEQPAHILLFSLWSRGPSVARQLEQSGAEMRLSAGRDSSGPADATDGIRPSASGGSDCSDRQDRVTVEKGKPETGRREQTRHNLTQPRKRHNREGVGRNTRDLVVHHPRTTAIPSRPPPWSLRCGRGLIPHRALGGWMAAADAVGCTVQYRRPENGTFVRSTGYFVFGSFSVLAVGVVAIRRPPPGWECVHKVGTI